MSLSNDSFFDSLINVPPVHDTENPHLVFDDSKHYAIIADT